MIVTYRYRIYPNKQQKLQLSKTFGCTRFVWNYFLAWREERYKEQKLATTEAECRKHLNSVLKEQYPWLREVDKFALEDALIRLDNAYNRFFKGLSGKPRFKKKKSHRFSYTTYSTNNNIQIDFGVMAKDKTKNRCWGKIRLPKLGWIKARIHRTFNGKIKTATVTLLPSGHYYVSIAVEVDKVNNKNQTPEPINYAVALDLGLKSFHVDSNGNRVEAPKVLAKYEKKLKKLQKALSRKKVKSKNFEKARIKLAKLYQKISNIRNDFLEKLSLQVINENQVIICEDLRVKNLVKNRRLAKSIHDASWSKFLRMLKYKAERRSRIFIQVSPNFPSSQTCSDCGYKNEEVKDLSVRIWECPRCGSVHDRDFNAARNILAEGLKLLSEINKPVGLGRSEPEGDACGGKTSTIGGTSLVASLVSEAGSS
ncbi:IS200/IS605 family element RNA-guided endonuclease TnpB [Fervidobacterium islandicum]|uniref:IS200/IS605 family element RNA-guided endonuclease TnpB n=1 Tax=Fervidobacterium islandicum TaxID=2423 RepID=UPI003A78EFAB